MMFLVPIVTFLSLVWCDAACSSVDADGSKDQGDVGCLIQSQANLVAKGGQDSLEKERKALKGNTSTSIRRGKGLKSASTSSSASYSTSTGLKSASTSYSTSTTWNNDTEAAACGGANLIDIYSTITALSLDMTWFPVAIAQSMAQPLTCSSADETTGTGSPSVDGAGYSGVLHLYCGQCAQFTAEDGSAVGVLVFDTCPYDGNQEWCPMNGNTNEYGYYNHLDIFAPAESAVTDVIGSNPTGTVELVDCPSEITDAITSLADATSSSDNDVCTFYYGSGQWQGSPGMEIYDCSEC